MRRRSPLLFAVVITIWLFAGGNLALAGSSQSSQDLLATAAALQTRAAQQQTVEATQTAAAANRGTPTALATMPPLNKVDKTWQPLWKAEVGLNKVVAQEFCLNPTAQDIIKMNLSNGVSLKAAAGAWIQASGGVNPMLLSAAQDYIAAYTAVTKSSAPPEWAYPLAAGGGVPVDKVIEQISLQYKGCDTGTYGQHA